MYSSLHYALIAGLVASALYAFAMGSNDMANSIAPLIGSGVLSYRRAIALFIVAVIAGAVIQGYMVMKTLGKGIVRELDLAGALAASFAGFTWIMIATLKGIPISTTHSIVGGVIGVGIAYTLQGLRTLNLDVVIKIILSWIVSPLSSMALAIPLYYFNKWLAKKGERIASLAAIVMAFIAAYSFGANDAANAAGVYVTITSRILGTPDEATMRLLALYVTVFAGVGGAIIGRRVVETMAYRITRLDITTGVAANADGIAVWLWTTVPYILFGYGMPISTTYAAVGAIIGAGVARHRSLRAINIKLVLFIMFAWVITVPVTASLAIAIYTLLKYIGV